MENNVKKSITIDGLSLSSSGGTKIKKPKRDKTARKIRPSSIVQPSTLKKTLLERIKQHQRLRERGRDDDKEHIIEDSKTADTLSSTSQKIGDETFTNNFSQSMDFLKKLALKKQQQRQQNATNNSIRNQTQKLDNSNRYTSSINGMSSSTIANEASAKTPEAKMLNKVAETLTNGEIITNTGIIGLPVHYKDLSNIMTNSTTMENRHTLSPLNVPAPLVNIQMAIPDNNSQNNANIPNLSNNNTSILSNISSGLPSPITPPIVPNIADLADMYNNTIASADSGSGINDGQGSSVNEVNANSQNFNMSNSSSNKETPIHVPQDPTSYLPSIFIKEEPPHGCLKQGKKPTFREWANKMLKKPVDTIKDIFSGGNIDNADDKATNHSGNDNNDNNENNSYNGIGGAKKLHDNNTILPENTTGMRVKIRKTLKKKFRVGKHDNVVGVLLKNKEAQRHIQKQHLTLKQKSIGDIRKHLYEKNLLKIGSNAPPDVLRRLYEDSILTGDVKNTSSNVLLHNFFSNNE